MEEKVRGRDLKTRRSGAPYQTQTAWWCLVLTTGGERVSASDEASAGGQLESCRRMLTWRGRRESCNSGARLPALFLAPGR